MKHRQYKKLCKKSAEVMEFKDCDVEEGIWYVYWYCLDGWDSEDAWPRLVRYFNGDVNIIIDTSSECGIRWVDNPQPSTPSDVFSWAKENFKIKEVVCRL